MQVPQDTSIADALLAQSPGGLCFSYVQQNAAGVVRWRTRSSCGG